MSFPGPIGTQLEERAKRVCATNTATSRIHVKTGSGVVVEDYDGFRFMDLACDASVINLGRDNPQVTAAIIDQVKLNPFSEHHHGVNLAAVEVAEFLVEHSPVKKPCKVFFSNSGSEANEAARKNCESCRYHHLESGRRKAIYFLNGFAGRTKGSYVATTSRPDTQLYPFRNHCDIEESLYLPFPKVGEDWSALKRHLDNSTDIFGRFIVFDEVDRLLIELPCQGEGGVIPIEEEALKYLYEVTQKEGIFFIADVIQCGMGRTGTIFGCDIFPWLRPDIMTMGKALGGSRPIGVTIFRADLDYQPGEHSNTFGGDPVAMRAALVAIEETEKLIRAGAVKMIEEILRERLTGYKRNWLVMDVRGKGAMWGLEFRTKELHDRFIRIGEELVNKHGLGLRLLGTSGKTVRLLPPLIITREELHQALNLFDHALKTLELEQK